MDVMESVCHSFDPNNIEAMQYNLYAGTRYFLHQLSIDRSQPAAIVEYIVLYYDGQSIQQRMYRYLREYYQNMRGEWEYAEISRNLTHYPHGFQFSALGTYGLEYQLKNRSKDLSDYTLDHMQTFLLHEAREQVYREESFQDRERRVGQPLKIITMDAQGMITADWTE